MPRRDVDKMWRRFTSVTRARIGLGRSGDALPTQHLLDFQYAHACARDAVAAHVDFAALAAQLQPTPTFRMHSRRATDRPTCGGPIWAACWRQTARPDCPRVLTTRHSSLRMGYRQAPCKHM